MTRQGWLLMFGVLAVVAGVILLVATWFGPQQPAGEVGQAGSGGKGGDGGGVITGEPLVEDVPFADVRTGVGQTRQTSFNMMDKDDPERIAGIFEYELATPKPQGIYDIDQPRAWIFLEDGRVLHVQADHAQVAVPGWPAQPESGYLEGNVVLRVLEDNAKEGGGGQFKLDPALATVLMRADMPTIEFDANLSELTTNDRVMGSTRELEFRGTGLTIRRDELRLQYIVRVSREGYARYSPRGDDAAGEGNTHTATRQDESVRTAQRPAEENDGAPASAGSEPKVDLYVANFHDDVLVTRRDGAIDADKLTVWSRLMDGALPEGAIKRVAGRRGGVMGSGWAMRGGWYERVEQAAMWAAVAQPGEVYEHTLTPVSDDDVVITWSGPMVLTPVEQTPEQLAEGNHFALSFSAQEPDGLKMTDADSGSRAVGQQITYLATTQRASMTNAPGYDVRMSMNNDASFAAREVAFDASTLLIDVLSGGRMMLTRGDVEGDGEGAGSIADESIIWMDDAQFQLARGTTGDIDRLASATFNGGVVAGSDQATLSGDQLVTRFEPAGQQQSALRHARVLGNVQGQDGKGGELASDQLDIEFEPRADNNDPNPVRVVARSKVDASRDGDRVRCEELVADLARNERDDVEVRTATMVGNVRVDRPDSTRAVADRIEANVIKQTASLLGERVELSRDTVAVIGTQMQVDGRDSSLFVHGGGSFVHQDLERNEQGELFTPRVTATWMKSMHYQDIAGQVECIGDVQVESRLKPMVEDDVRAHRITLFFTPGDGSGDSLASSEAGVDVQGRRFMRAEAAGSITEREDGEPAHMESRVYATDQTAYKGQRLERFVQLRGRYILADDDIGQLRVPSAGRAVIFDGRTASENTAAEIEGQDDIVGVPLAGGSGFRGSAMFTWDGSMTFDRASGELKMLRDVQLVHQPLKESDPVVAMECEQLTAFVGGDESTGVNGSTAAVSLGEQAELRKAIAQDAVYVRSNQRDGSDKRELIADKLVYDASSSLATATAKDGGRITLFDPQRGAPVIAKGLTWNLLTNEIELRDPKPISTPR